MAISPITVGEGGASVRAKLNTAIDQANLVAGKADAVDVTADVQALQVQINAKASAAALTAEAATRLASVQDLQTQVNGKASAIALTAEEDAREVGDNAVLATATIVSLSEHARIGEPGAFATAQTAGAPSAVPPLGSDAKVVGPDGAAVAVVAGIVAPVAVYHPEPGRQYRLRIVFRRATDTQDPANDAIRLGVQWLTATKAGLSASILEDITDITVASGRVERSFTLARTDADNVDVLVPAAAVYCRPYVRCYGSGLTYVDAIYWVDLTDAIDWSPDFSPFRNEVAGLEQRTSTLEDRMGVAEEDAAEAHDARYITSGTLDDDRLSANVMLLANDQTVTGKKTFDDAVRLHDDVLIGDGTATGSGPTGRITGYGDRFALVATDQDGDFRLGKELLFEQTAGVWHAEGGFKTSGVLTVTDDATVAGDADVAGALTVVGVIDAQGGLDVTGGVTADAIASSGGLTVAGTATVNDAVVQDDLSVGGDATVAGGLTVTGAAALSSATFSDAAATRTSLDVYNKAYVDALIAAADAMVFKGVVDCSANPNYPAANAGWTYRVSVAGKIGGASGRVVEVGDLLLCLVDASATGTEASVGGNWNISQTNIDGAVVGPASATDATPVLFDGSSGKLIKATTFSAFKTSLVLVKADVGLGNVDNTGDATKNSAVATLTNKTLIAPAVSAPTGIVKGDVGLGNVDNTADADKPVSTAAASALSGKYDKTGGTLTGPVTFNHTASLVWSVDASAEQVSLTSGSTLTIPNGSGALTIANNVTGCLAFVLISGGAITVIGQTSGSDFVNTDTPSASQIGIYYSGVNYIIKNGFATTQDLRLTGVKLRPTV